MLISLFRVDVKKCANRDFMRKKVLQQGFEPGSPVKKMILCEKKCANRDSNPGRIAGIRTGNGLECE